MTRLAAVLVLTAALLAGCGDGSETSSTAPTPSSTADAVDAAADGDLADPGSSSEEPDAVAGASDPVDPEPQEEGDAEEFDAECPAPETLDAQQVGCTDEGVLYDLTAPIGQVDECPAPETLQAEGVACDSTGMLYPAITGD